MIILPRGYLSYSAYKLWRTSKDQYRRRYYENEPTFETAETIFGKQIADWLESDDPQTRHIPNYLNREYDIEVELEGTLIKGRIDGFDENLIRFLDHKSGHADNKGQPPWNRLKVHKLDQLPFYSMLLKEKFGKVNNRCHIVWIETKFVTKKTIFDGHELSAQSRELQMTGRVKKYPRVIREFERKRIKADLLLAIKEISDDYENYTRNKGILLKSGKIESPEAPKDQRTIA